MGGIIPVYSEATILELIDLIYGAAADPQRWVALLKRLGEILKGTASSIHHQDLGSGDTDISETWNFDSAYLASYAEYYAHRNVFFTTRPEIVRQGRVHLGSDLVPSEILDRSEYCNDWLLPQNLYHGAGVIIRNGGPLSSNFSVLSLLRPRSAEPFDERDGELLRVLKPHLQRAFELHRRIQGLERKGSAAAELLNHLQAGVILLDARGLVIFANDSANLIFRREKALKLTSKGIRAMSPAEDKKLGRLVAEAVSTGSGRGFRAGGTMAIERESLTGFLHLLVTPLHLHTIQFGKTSPVAAIFITDTDRKALAPPRLLVQLYGVTHAEARLAQLLASGASIKEASEKLNVSQSTLRSQLKSIFGKTNVNRQSELVRMLLTGPLQFVLRDTPPGPKRG